MTRAKSKYAVLLAILVLLTPMLAVSGAARQEGMVERLNLGGFGGGSNPQSNFNPYVVNKLAGTAAYIYEPLMILNLNSCEIIPWLATQHQWTDPQTLVLTMREGVTWSDGTPFTAADVAFSFGLLQKYPPLDEVAVWQGIASVTAAHPTVTIAFKEPGAFLFQKVVERLIVPKHLWEGVADPVTYTNDEPVGTGPFRFKNFNGQQLTLERNDTYWQAEKVRVQEVIYTKADEGQINQLKLAEGAFDSNAMFVPDIEQTYVAKDPEHNHYWFPQGSPISLYFNVTMAPFDDPEFRRGVAYAIDRNEIAQKAQFGYVQPASQTGLNVPGHQAFIDPAIPNAGLIPYDVAQADQIFAAAGYTKDGDGKLLGKDGKAVQFTFSVQAGWNDWVQASQIIQEDLAAVGITMDVQTITPDIVIADRKAGNYQATFGVDGGSCTMYDNFNNPLNSALTAPAGKDAISNFIRWQDPQTDQLLAQLRAAADPETQKPILFQLEQIMMTKFPFIPLWYGAIWFEYSTRNAVGWPNAENPYAKPGNNNNDLLIITSLTPA